MSEAVGQRPRSYLVECYWPGVSAEQVMAVADRVHAATDALRERGADVDFVGSILVPADETVFCLFDGTEEYVREASAQAGIPFERVLESLRVEGGKQREEDEVQ